MDFEHQVKKEDCGDSVPVIDGGNISVDTNRDSNSNSTSRNHSHSEGSSGNHGKDDDDEGGGGYADGDGIGIEKVVIPMHHLKTVHVGSFNNLSDAGSSRIYAANVEGQEESRWAMVSVFTGVTVVDCLDNQHSQHMEICNCSTLSDDGIALVKQVTNGFEAGYSPEKAEEGIGGTYFMANTTGQKVAIFKPCDEEPFAPCNPKGFVGRSLGDPGLKPTVRVGEAALREVAAYLLDHKQFAKVPTTVLMRASHPVFTNIPEVTTSDSYLSDLDTRSTTTTTITESTRTTEGSIANQSHHDDGDAMLPIKLGSMQEFVAHLCDTTEMGTSKFSVSDVQRIAILDIRLYNTDRHAGNILVRKAKCTSQAKGQFGDSGYELVPIDHGFCLPEALEPPYFEWQHWSQARMPLGEQEREYIARIDIEADKKMLRNELPVIREESLRTMEVATTLLKKCAAAGLSLNEIAEIMSRPLVGMDKEKSDLEKLCRDTRDELWKRYYHNPYPNPNPNPNPNNTSLESTKTTTAIVSTASTTETTRTMTTTTVSESESEDSETPNCGGSSNGDGDGVLTPHSQVDDTVFRMDDWKELEIRRRQSQTPFLNSTSSRQQDEKVSMEKTMKQLSIEETTKEIAGKAKSCYGCVRTTHRSMSMVLPTSSVCFQKRGGDIRAQRHQRDGQFYSSHCSSNDPDHHAKHTPSDHHHQENYCQSPHHHHDPYCHRNSNDSPKKNENRVAYPPYIHGTPPADDDQVFHHISNELWPCFMDILRRKINDGLKKEKWMSVDGKKRAMSMNLGISCPRF